jgi:hypothetical protein
MSGRSRLRDQTKGGAPPPVKIYSPRNLIQGLGLDGTVGNDLKHGNWIIILAHGTYDHPIKRPVGKPKKRWMDAVKEDSYPLLKWRNWDMKAQDKDEWRSRIKKAKARFGLQCY